MLIETIRDGAGADISQIYDLGNVSGVGFPTPENYALQFGYAAYPNGKNVPAHIHNRVERKLDVTAEFIFVLDGVMTVRFLDAEGQALGERKFTKDMAFLQVGGGHEILFSEGARYFELKQGPYLGRDADKKAV